MRNDGFLPRLGYEHPDQNDEPRPDPFASADLDLTKKIAAIIDFHYLGQPFLVKVSHEQGVVQIQIPALMGATNWFVIPIRYLKSDPGMKHIVRGCGDILERYNIPRAHFDRDHYVAALTAIPFGRRAYGHVPK